MPASHRELPRVARLRLPAGYVVESPPRTFHRDPSRISAIVAEGLNDAQREAIQRGLHADRNDAVVTRNPCLELRRLEQDLSGSCRAGSNDPQAPHAWSKHAVDGLLSLSA